MSHNRRAGSPALTDARAADLGTLSRLRVLSAARCPNLGPVGLGVLAVRAPCLTRVFAARCAVDGVAADDLEVAHPGVLVHVDDWGRPSRGPVGQTDERARPRRGEGDMATWIGMGVVRSLWVVLRKGVAGTRGDRLYEVDGSRPGFACVTQCFGGGCSCGVLPVDLAGARDAAAPVV